jgi:hypothetical protein
LLIAFGVINVQQVQPTVLARYANEIIGVLNGEIEVFSEDVSAHTVDAAMSKGKAVP